MAASLVSIVIISKNERALAATLEALGRVSVDLELEIVVVDASEGALEDIRLANERVRWVDFAAMPGKRITIPEQRNVGVHAARGELIVFIDSGCVPETDWLAELLRPIREGGEQVTCGSTGSLRADALYADRLSEGYLEECATINLALTRHAFDTVGGFDESFDYCSDTDFSWRLIDHGFVIRAVPAARLVHDWGSHRRQAKRSWYYGAGRAQLYLKHPRRWRRLVTHDPVMIAYPLYLLGLPLLARFPSYALLPLVPMWRNRRSKPILTVVNHFCYGAGVLATTGRAVRMRFAGASGGRA